MSEEARDLLAAAASDVDGVSCSPYFRQTTQPGQAFVRLDRINRDDTGLGFMASWQVCVLLPQDQATAEKWIDKCLSALCEALNTEGIVTTAQPVQLSLDTGTVPALVITVIRESE